MIFNTSQLKRQGKVKNQAEPSPSIVLRIVKNCRFLCLLSPSFFVSCFKARPLLNLTSRTLLQLSFSLAWKSERTSDEVGLPGIFLVSIPK